MPLAAIGQPVRRREDQRLITGKGRFTDDFAIDGQTYAAMVRSPHPHARIVSIDTAAARAMPGVRGVFTSADCDADGLHPIPHSALPSTKYDMKLVAPGGGKPFNGPHYLLAANKVRYVGEGVAFVVAETKAQALDAAEAVIAQYETLAWVTDAKAACEPGAPAVWGEAPDNVLIDTMFGDAEATDRAFAKADHVVKMDFHVPRVTAAAMEPRAALAAYDAATGRYTLHAGSGGAVKQKHEIAATLGIAPERLRILSLDVGGSFGSKNRPYVEFALALWASKKVGRPVKYTATRSETFLTDYQGRDLVTTVELALRKDGRFLAMRADNISNVGANCVSLSPLGKGSALITGSYDIPVASLRARAVFTNTMPTNAYRSSGRPEVTFAIERLVDMAAMELEIDRVKLRRKNLVPKKAMPYANAVGAVYDSGHYEENMDLAMRIADVAGFKMRRKAAKKRGRLLGLGLANYVESSIGAPKERVEITVKPDGRVTVVIGTQPSGQGHETSFAQVVADLLGVPAETVDIVMGDTDIVSVGGGSHSGRSMRHAATVIAKAAPDMIARGRKIAALVLQIPADKIEFKDGRFVTAQSNRTFDLLDLAKEAGRIALPLDLKDGLAVAADNEMHDPVFPNGCAVCEIEVDPDTGGLAIIRYAAVDDVGRCINPMIVHGQTHGGIAQGVGEAMWELCAIDPDSGQPLAGSFMDYGMP
ncbi:MAG TPA: xanthine dehydrogenase family protein molybdopterin-binding subunit, partial [Pseudolabrys sp.]|nr:xanthine dehydrogenase family protein molybdopterin-binding subunit [Pseudolabrys sp.]